MRNHPRIDRLLEHWARHRLRNPGYAARSPESRIGEGSRSTKPDTKLPPYAGSTQNLEVDRAVSAMAEDYPHLKLAIEIKYTCCDETGRAISAERQADLYLQATHRAERTYYDDLDRAGFWLEGRLGK